MWIPTFLKHHTYVQKGQLSNRYQKSISVASSGLKTGAKLLYAEGLLISRGSGFFSLTNTEPQVYPKHTVASAQSLTLNDP